MYTAFAEVYDELMGDVDYISWVQLYTKIMAYFGVKGGMIAECACGTGSMTLPLYQSGFSVTGVDVSAEMLFEASKKARREGIAIPFIKQDMRKLKLHRPMDAVLCTCDGLNYLTKKEDVMAFFGAAFSALRPGGGIFFDVSTPYKLENVLGNNLLMQDGERITYIWSNHFSKRTKMCELDLCLFVKDKDGRYDRMDEHQVQKAHTMEDITGWLIEAGFTSPRVYGEKAMEPPRETEERWHFAATKRVI